MYAFRVIFFSLFEPSNYEISLSEPITFLRNKKMPQFLFIGGLFLKEYWSGLKQIVFDVSSTEFGIYVINGLNKYLYCFISSLPEPSGVSDRKSRQCSIQTWQLTVLVTSGRQKLVGGAGARVKIAGWRMWTIKRWDLIHRLPINIYLLDSFKYWLYQINYLFCIWIQ